MGYAKVFCFSAHLSRNLYPSCLHATVASFRSQLSLHIVPYSPLWKISRRRSSDATRREPSSSDGADMNQIQTEFKN